MPFNTTGQPTPQALTPDRALLGIAANLSGTPAALLLGQVTTVGQETPGSLFLDLRLNVIADDSRGTPFTLLSSAVTLPGRSTPQSLVPDVRVNWTINADATHGSPAVLLFVLSIRESLPATDTVSASFSTTIVEAGSAADAVSAGLTLGGTLTEYIPATDDFPLVGWAMIVNEAGALADTVSTFVSDVATLTEAGAALETVSGQSSVSGSLVEFGAAVDRLSGGFLVVGTIAEQIAPIGQDFDEPFDLLTVTLGATGSLTESGALADTQAFGFVAIGTLTEAGAAADTASAVIAVVTSIAERIAASADSLTIGQSLNVSITEAAAALESVLGEAFTSLSIAEQGALVDTVVGLGVQFQYGNGRFWQIPGPPPFR
jgi:hypothetical protein